MKKILIYIFLFILLLTGCAEDSNDSKEADTKIVSSKSDEELQIEEEKRPVFYTKSFDVLGNKGTLKIEDSYITNRVTAGNHYYIDENAVLWGEGQNAYGQLGNGEVTEQNPFAMTIEPYRIAENVVSMDCSINSYFAIYLTSNGELYTWGLNIFGECGVPVTDDDYVRTPQKVLENVRMVWIDEIKFNSIEKEIPERMDFSTDYVMNVFVELENGEIMAAGQNIGTQTKTIGLTGDLSEVTTHTYSDTFIPVEIKKY